MQSKETMARLSQKQIDVELKIETMLAYIYQKLEEGDYHAVSDACMDVLCLEREAKVIKSMVELANEETL